MVQWNIIPLENLMLLQAKWPNKDLPTTRKKIVHVIGVNDFCTMVQCTHVEKLRHLSPSFLHEIPKDYPPIHMASWKPCIINSKIVM